MPADLERGDLMALVATDVAGHGIDVPDVTHAVDYGAPEDREACVHRTGRTGRAGSPGRSGRDRGRRRAKVAA